MSAESSGADILDQYKTISGKLKKRFRRKPNVSEACKSFSTLGKQCEHLEMPTYAGMCWIAAARCEGSLRNNPGETSSLLKAARNFFDAEVKNKSLRCQGVANENVQAALSYYAHAQSRLADNSPLGIGMSLEICESLNKLGNKELPEMYLREAVDLSKDSLDINLHCMQLLASNCINRNDYTTALETLTEMTNKLEKSPPNAARSDLLLNCEINRVLLLLVLRPVPQKLAPHLAKLLEKYTWGDKNDPSLNACGMSEELFLLMQSLVMTCQSLDTSSLPSLEGDLWPYFNADQKNLLRSLIVIYHL